MATETLTEKRQRYATEYQALLQSLIPTADFSVGTVLYELVVKPAAMLWADQDMSLDTLRNNMSLKQVLNSPDPDPTLTDNLLSNYNVARKPGSQATGLINIFTNSNQSLFLSITTTITCGETVIHPVKSYVAVEDVGSNEDTAGVAYVQFRQFDASTWVFTIAGLTKEATNTVLSAGQACTIDNNQVSIKKVEIGSTFVGGAVEETTVELLQRAAVGVNALVTTGRDNIRALLQNTGDFDISDIAVFGMGDALQLRDASNNGGISNGGRVDVYVATSAVPIVSTPTIAGVKQTDGRWKLRIPETTYAGAYGVLQIQYGDLLINTNIETQLTTVPTTYPLIRTALHARYSRYQILDVVFDAPTVPGIVGASADFLVSIMHMPVIAELQDFMEGVNVRSFGFDTVVKAAIPVVVSVAVTIEYPTGLVVPTVTEFQQVISDIINLKKMGTEALFSSDIVYACKLLFPNGLVRMPVTMNAKVWLPDGAVAYTSDDQHIRVMEDTGISYLNSSFYCYPGDVEVTLTEIFA